MLGLFLCFPNCVSCTSFVVGFFFISLINPQAAVIIQTPSEIQSKKHVEQMSKTNNKNAVFRWKRKSVALSNGDKYIFFIVLVCFSFWIWSGHKGKSAGITTIISSIFCYTSFNCCWKSCHQLSGNFRK